MALDKFFEFLSPKSRVIVFLLSLEGMNIDLVRKLTVAEAKRLIQDSSIRFEFEIDSALLDLIDGKAENAKVFTTPAGRLLSAKNIEDILKRAHERAGIKYKGRLAFSNYIKEGNPL